MRETDALTRLILTARTAKELENPFKILFADTAPIVGDLYANRTPSGRIGRAVNLSGRPGIWYFTALSKRFPSI